MMGCSSSKATSKASEEANAAFTGTGEGHNGDIVVKVGMDGKTITSVTVVKQSETAYIANPALTRIPELIVKNQSLEFDAVAGATMTTDGIREAVSAALAQADLSADDLAKSGTATGLVAEKPIEADIAIVGGGLSGLSALARLLQQGRKAVLFEESAHVGGSCCVSDGWITGAGTKLEKAQGIEDSPEKMCQYMLAAAKAMGAEAAYPEIVKAYCDKSGEVVDWLDSYINVDFGDRTGGYGLYVAPDTPRIYGVPGGDRLVEALLNIIDDGIAAGNASIILDAHVTGIKQGADGTVNGLEVTYATGDVETFDYRAVLLCTGGYSSNRDMLDQNGFTKYGSGAPATAAGHGFELAQSAGAQLVLMQMSTPYPASINMGTLARRYKANVSLPGCIWVSKLGKRVVSEDKAVMAMPAWGRMPEQTGYVVFSEAQRIDGTRPIVKTSYLDAEITPWQSWDMLDELVGKSKSAFKAESATELAQLAGIDAASLEATIESYNASCEAGVDGEFGRKNNLQKLEGTLYAIMSYPYQIQTSGGVRMSTNAEVLDGNGKAIPGLFVAGEQAGFSQWSVGGHGGTGLGGAATWGYIAADAAKAYIG